MAKTFVLECPQQCSLGPGSRHGTQVTQWMLAGRTYRWICDETKELFGVVLFPGNLTRHKKHIVVTGRDAEPDVEADSLHKANNIEILETIIQKGFQNAKNWKPTISDTMKAMDMWFKLTQGNPFDDLLDTLASAAIGERVGETNTAAVALRDELPDLPEEDEELVPELVEA